MKIHGSHTTELANPALLILLGAVQFAFAHNSNTNIQKRHVQMVTPQPFLWDEYGPTNPLNPDGSDYPCKVPRGEDFKVSSSPTEMVIGEPQVVSFSGWAVHGGGSCQFALTEGVSPTSDSAWKVIHSVEGGCPKANVAGNLELGQSPDNYTFSVPEGFDPGEYTFAWTWVNRIAGQPEFYMNCAPVTVKVAGASPTRRARERREAVRRRRSVGQKSYPDLFLANIGDASHGCDTSDALRQQVAIKYPYPGDSVSYPDGTANLFEQPCDGNPRNSDNGSAVTGGGSVASAPARTSVSPEFSVPPGSAPTTISSSSLTTAQMLSATSTESPSVLRTPVSISHTTVSKQSSAPVVASTAASVASPSSTAGLSSPCTDGHLMCVGGTQFSTCTGGMWTGLQDLASNARCKEEGESDGLDITVIP